jgi:signal transduction histidine kinase
MIGCDDIVHRRNLTGSIPNTSDLDRFSLALQFSREQVGALYERSVELTEREHHAQLLAAIHDLSIAEEELRAQHEAISAAQRDLEAERQRDATHRQQTEDSLLALNRSLNARVAQRTRELELALEGEQAARKDAEAANRIKTELFARLSHEFRTPLHAVSGYLEILQQNIHGALTEEQRRDLDRISQAQEHLMALVNMILDFAKLEAGPIELSMAEIPIEETLLGAEALVFPQFAKKKIAYTHRPGDRSSTVFADREKVQQIVVNLLANAMKFTPEGGAVELDWKVEDDTLLVRVRDTGPGIPPERLEQIFEPFVQLRAPGSLPSGGTGLGLPISRDLARAMGGEVHAASAMGRGSEFSLFLPLRKHAGAKLSAPRNAG